MAMARAKWSRMEGMPLSAKSASLCTKRASKLVRSHSELFTGVAVRSTSCFLGPP